MKINVTNNNSSLKIYYYSTFYFAKMNNGEKAAQPAVSHILGRQRKR